MLKFLVDGGLSGVRETSCKDQLLTTVRVMEKRSVDEVQGFVTLHDERVDLRRQCVTGDDILKGINGQRSPLVSPCRPYLDFFFETCFE